MAQPQRVEAHREASGTNGDLGHSKGPHPAVAGSGQDRDVSQGEFHGAPVQGESPQRPEPRSEPAVGGGGAPGLATPGATREPRQPAGPGATPGMSSAGSTPRAGGRATRPQTGLLYEGSPLRGVARSPRAAGLQTFGSKYMPFAAGFAHMAGEAPVYRSSRLHALNPTAAVSEDTSYLYTLDSGLETAATRAANPDRRTEHVRNTAPAARGGLAGRLFGPIR
ncbi:hypothetical protein CHLNCDRAFT_133749 [Chlorella variabilis]|uniref:Uncharacterized protein n=1 Tax=Chlorella variabilis TaxID=554065 RepID=E1ZF58_CHLVA|nr:hypothetical protein CHLNCDRAFT_133749 [Chlorella variabilis]EFN55443.1 hypothetical protein CHLNCDRAFT_133749 [Chlorella variabilis]|eukprot:XP_005847545.1 hypothetical protein CHLNCDRAFT_133749 [Chlorella variabilis]